VVITVVQTAALASIAAALHRGEASRLAPWQFSGPLFDTSILHVVAPYGSLFGALLVIGGGFLAQTFKWPERT
jgi:hypothetical protein